jgi:hypothetical protein
VADTVKKVSYGYVTVPNLPGQGVRVVSQMRDAGINMLGFMGIPGKPRRAELDFVVEDMAALRRLAKRNGWRLSSVKQGFLVQGTDRLGAMHRHLERLADAKISITASAAVAAGKGRYGMLIWVKKKDHNRAAKALGAR